MWSVWLWSYNTELYTETLLSLKWRYKLPLQWMWLSIFNKVFRHIFSQNMKVSCILHRLIVDGANTVQCKYNIIAIFVISNQTPRARLSKHLSLKHDKCNICSWAVTKRSTPFTQKGVPKMTKMNIYYSFCSILRPKGVILLLNTMTKRSTPSTQKGVAKLTKMNIYYSFCSILRPKGVLLLLNIMTKRSTPFAQYYDQKEYSFQSILL